MDIGKLVKIGKIISAHGVRGLVKIKSYAESPSNISAYGEIYDHSENKILLEIKSSNKDILIARIENIDSREAAEQISKTDLYVNRHSLPELEDDDFYIEDLVGMKVITDSNQHIGNVVAVQNFGAGDILKISFLKDGKSEHIPFTKKHFPDIDLHQKTIKINLF